MRLTSSLFLAVCIACAGVASAQEESAPASTEIALTAEQQAELAAAEANEALIATRPEWVGGPDAVYPEEERALGHHGTVEVRALLGVDGRLRYVVMTRSSRAPALDAIALASIEASEYRPAKDANGNPIPTMITAVRMFESYISSEDVGAAMYTCSQFVLDMDWYKEAWGEEALNDHRFYMIIRGLGTIARLSGGGGAASIESNESYLRRWNRAIETCRDRPNWRFAQAMRPEGEYIDRMARNLSQRN